MKPTKPRPRPANTKRFPPRKPSKKMVALGNKLLAPCLALAVVLGTAAAGSGDGDYELMIRWPGGEAIHAPAKSEADCIAAMMGWWKPLNMPPIADAEALSCTPHPGYFSARSNCIAGYSC